MLSARNQLQGTVSHINRGAAVCTVTVRLDGGQQIVSTITHGRADLRETSPEPSIWPFMAAIAATILFVGSMFTPWALVWGSVPLAVTLIGWFWPKPSTEDEK